MTLDAARGLLACPTCGHPLSAVDGNVGCEEGHRFDVALQVYVNLLGSKPPANADTAAMVAARSRVLASGLFDPVAADVARRVAEVTLLGEVGAGTAFYLGRALGDRADARGVALDVSVAAARAAARVHPRVASVVADVWQTLPLRSGRLGALLCVFAPRNMGEFARVLAGHGLLVVVTPTEHHLVGLREELGLLGIEPDKDARLLRSAVGLFEPVARNRIDYSRPATAEQVRDLITMGPNAFHGVPESVPAAEVRISVTVSLFRRPSA